MTAMPDESVQVVKVQERAESAAEVSGIIRLAIEEKVPVETLERLLDMHERVADRNARSEFVRAMAAFQAECPALPKGKPVDYTTKTGVRIRYDFASLDDIARTVRPILARHGLFFSFSSEESGGMLSVTCRVSHVDGHSEASTFRCSIADAGSPTMNGPQKTGSAQTYGQRYSLIQALGLTTAEPDHDGNPESHGVITVEQEADLKALIDEVGAEAGAALLKWARVERLCDLPASKFARARSTLEKKRENR